MKRTYIIPNTTSVLFQTEHICQAVVGSVQGNLGLEFSEIGGDPI